MRLLFWSPLFLAIDWTIVLSEGKWELDPMPDELGLVLLGIAAIHLGRLSVSPKFRVLVLASSGAFVTHLILKGSALLWRGTGSEAVAGWSYLVFLFAGVLLCSSLMELCRNFGLRLTEASWRRSRLLILIGPFLVGTALAFGVRIAWWLGRLPEPTFSWNLGELMDWIERAAAQRDFSQTALAVGGCILGSYAIFIALVALVHFLLSCSRLRREAVTQPLSRAESAR